VDGIIFECPKLLFASLFTEAVIVKSQCIYKYYQNLQSPKRERHRV